MCLKKGQNKEGTNIIYAKNIKLLNQLVKSSSPLYCVDGTGQSLWDISLDRS